MRKFGIRAKYMNGEIYWVSSCFDAAHTLVNNITFVVNCPAKADKTLKNLLANSEFRNLWLPYDFNNCQFYVEEIL